MKSTYKKANSRVLNAYTKLVPLLLKYNPSQHAIMAGRGEVGRFRIGNNLASKFVAALKKHKDLKVVPTEGDNSTFVLVTLRKKGDKSEVFHMLPSKKKVGRKVSKKKVTKKVVRKGKVRKTRCSTCNRKIISRAHHHRIVNGKRLSCTSPMGNAAYGAYGTSRDIARYIKKHSKNGK